jgi:hypothetical protein
MHDRRVPAPIKVHPQRCLREPVGAERPRAAGTRDLEARAHTLHDERHGRAGECLPRVPEREERLDRHDGRAGRAGRVEDEVGYDC